MRQYLELCQHIIKNGVVKEDRTGTGTVSTFGYQMRFDLSEGFPLVTTKDMIKPNKFGVTRLDGIIYELLWFLDGNTNIKYLLDNGVNIWNYDAYRFYNENSRKSDEELTYDEFVEIIKLTPYEIWQGDLGPIYDSQWRSWVSDREASCYCYDDAVQETVIDQIASVIETIKRNPDSRRLIVSAWNVADLPEMALPPCHVLFQFYVANGKLSCQLYQRSGDVFLGVPYNIASYALLTMMIAQQTGLEVGEFIHTLGDAHIYSNHIEQVKLQLSREPRELPNMEIIKADSIDSYTRESFVLSGYNPHPAIVGKVSF